ncbi:hypothetical protein EOPP23_00970 [Endozoicomonas sp. OPT23]|uniref:methyltransferase domain-containing protein n=1 Tax=Endozoicomonas sp. OPT23 TaxID=2072845 RepID=UPI00129B3141|nr:methyltransferase domain-containing protein [Endozoicomonas sp. OPT23]MRI31563.1 hypothetical protein [Endozoicomonas sp. OPT23]
MRRPVHISKNTIIQFLLISLWLVIPYISYAELTLNPDASRNSILSALHKKQASTNSATDHLIKKLISRHPPLPGQHILGIGNALSKNALFIAKEFHVSVVSIDIAASIQEQIFDSDDNFHLPVRFINKNSTNVSFSNESFDAVFSSDDLIYLENKEDFLNKAYNWLKPGGKILFTTFCLDSDPLSDKAKDQFQQRHYYPNSTRELKSLLRVTGFEEITTLNRETEILQLLKSSLRQLRQQRKEFLKTNSEANYKALTEGWKGDIERIKKQQQTWTVFQAIKPGQGTLHKVFAQGT